LAQAGPSGGQHGADHTMRVRRPVARSLVLARPSHPCVVPPPRAAMPGKRSYVWCEGEMSAAQRRRRARDLYYCTSHSSPGKSFIEVDSAFRDEARALVRGRALHRQRDIDNGFVSHHGRMASIAAQRAGSIDERTLKSDLQEYQRANVAKHGGRRVRWADADDENPDHPQDLDPLTFLDPWAIPPTASGTRRCTDHVDAAVPLDFRFSRVSDALGTAGVNGGDGVHDDAVPLRLSHVVRADVADAEQCGVECDVEVHVLEELPLPPSEARFDGEAFAPSGVAAGACCWELSSNTLSSPYSCATWQELVEAQNTSLALLVGKMETCVDPLAERVSSLEAQSKVACVRLLERRLEDLWQVVERLAASLSVKVAEKVQAAVANLYELVDASESKIVDGVTTMLRGIDGGYQKQFSELQAAFRHCGGPSSGAAPGAVFRAPWLLGEEVCLVGLQATELNGKTGVIIEDLDSHGRLGVSLVGESERECRRVRVKEGNLQRVSAVPSAPHGRLHTG